MSIGIVYQGGRISGVQRQQWCCSRISAYAQNSLAGSALVGAVAEVAVFAVGDAAGAAAAVTDEVQRDLHLLVEAQRLDLNGLRLALLGTARGCHVDGERHLQGSTAWKGTSGAC